MKVFTKDRVKKDNHNMSKKRSSQTKLWNLYARRGCPNCSVPRAGEFRNLGFKHYSKDKLPPVERRRRFNINDRIKELGTLLPTQNEPYYELVRKAVGDFVRMKC